MMNPSPPTPDIFGSTTFSAAAVAMAASTALPPRCSAAIPACVASGCPAHTIPLRPMTTGRLDSKLMPWGVCGIVGASFGVWSNYELLPVQILEQAGAAINAVYQLFLAAIGYRTGLNGAKVVAFHFASKEQ